MFSSLSDSIFQSKKILSIFFIILLVCINRVEIAKGNDAIAIRVLPNPEHYSVERWYANKNIKGSPQTVIINGYKGIRDGSTAFVSAANVNSDNYDFQTNIYLITYNSTADRDTIVIFGELLKNWKFNTNLTSETLKQRLIRDTQRLADYQDIKIALDEYKATKGHYPLFPSGSYLPSKTVSTWPSWQNTFGAMLGKVLPTDPLNRFGKCKSSNLENIGYDPVTCWNEKELKTALTITPKIGQPDLIITPLNSYVYTYTVMPSGTRYQLNMKMETGYLTLDGIFVYTARLGDGLTPNTCDFSGQYRITSNPSNPGACLISY